MGKIISVKLFVVPMGGKRFAVYLAEEEGEARAQHRRVYGVIFRICGGAVTENCSSVK